VPPTLLFLPLSRLVAILGLQDSLWSLVLVYPSFTIPVSTWLLMGFFKSIPKELEDAAMVDGLTLFGAFLKLVIPISVSGILTVTIFSFTLVTQEFVYALTFISSESRPMVGVGMPIFLVRGDVYYWGSLMAACLITSLPIALLYNLFLDRFIAAFTGRWQAGGKRISVAWKCRDRSPAAGGCGGRGTCITYTGSHVDIAARIPLFNPLPDQRLLLGRIGHSPGTCHQFAINTGLFGGIFSAQTCGKAR
jgi:hypothetical protein